jgi:hypothetical protein
MTDDLIRARLLVKWTEEQLEAIQERMVAAFEECDGDELRAAGLLLDRGDTEALNVIFETMRAASIDDAGGLQ